MSFHSQIEKVTCRLNDHVCVQAGIGQNETILYFDDASKLVVEREIKPEVGTGLDAITKIALSRFAFAASTSESIIQLVFANGCLLIQLEDDDHGSLTFFDEQMRVVVCL